MKKKIHLEKIDPDLLWKSFLVGIKTDSKTLCKLTMRHMAINAFLNGGTDVKFS